MGNRRCEFSVAATSPDQNRGDDSASTSRVRSRLGLRPCEDQADGVAADRKAAAMRSRMTNRRAYSAPSAGAYRDDGACGLEAVRCGERETAVDLPHRGLALLDLPA